MANENQAGSAVDVDGGASLVVLDGAVDLTVRHVFAASLDLHAAAALADAPEVVERIMRAISRLDRAVTDLHSGVRYGGGRS